jgi:hypothetical protein
MAASSEPNTRYRSLVPQPAVRSKKWNAAKIEVQVVIVFAEQVFQVDIFSAKAESLCKTIQHLGQIYYATTEGRSDLARRTECRRTECLSIKTGLIKTLHPALVDNDGTLLCLS